MTNARRSNEQHTPRGNTSGSLQPPLKPTQRPNIQQTDTTSSKDDPCREKHWEHGHCMVCFKQKGGVKAPHLGSHVFFFCFFFSAKKRNAVKQVKPTAEPPSPQDAPHERPLALRAASSGASESQFAATYISEASEPSTYQTVESVV